MAIELKVPTVGESITEVQIGEWLKAEGDSVTHDEIIVKIETDKSDGRFYRAVRRCALAHLGQEGADRGGR